MEGRGWVVVGRVSGWDVLRRAVWAETEPRSVAKPYIEQSSDLIWQACPQGIVEGRGLEVVSRVDGWDVLGRAVWAETEPLSIAEPNIEQSSD